MRTKTKFVATVLVVAPVLAYGLSAAPIGPAQACRRHLHPLGLRPAGSAAW
jgi:hypothetical protein